MLSVAPFVQLLHSNVAKYIFQLDCDLPRRWWLIRLRGEGSMSSKRMNTLKVVWLETFLALIEHKTYEKTAKSLNCTHTTVSRQMKGLEDWLGVSPFSQIGPIKLSEAGEKLEPVALQIVALLSDFGVREVWKEKSSREDDLNAWAVTSQMAVRTGP